MCRRDRHTEAMSGDCMDAVRRSIDAWNRGDLDTWLAALEGVAAPQFEVHPVVAPLGDGGDAVYTGTEGLREFWSDLREVADIRMESTDIRDLGDALVVLNRVSATGRNSGVNLGSELAAVLTLEGGRLIRCEHFLSHADALDAASKPDDAAVAAVERSERATVRLAGGLLLGGVLINAIATSFHPPGDDRGAAFVDYFTGVDWVAVHIAEFVGVLTALAGLLVLYRALRVRDEAPALSLIAAAGAVATGATFALLQVEDAIALKNAIDAWEATGAGQAAGLSEAGTQSGDTETLRWLEWGIQGYFRVLLGVTLALFGTAIAIARLVVPRWLGWSGALAGLMLIVNGIVEITPGGGFYGAALAAFQAMILVFAIGLLVVGMQRTGSSPGPLPGEERGLRS